MSKNIHEVICGTAPSDGRYMFFAIRPALDDTVVDDLGIGRDLAWVAGQSAEQVEDATEFTVIADRDLADDEPALLILSLRYKLKSRYIGYTILTDQLQVSGADPLFEQYKNQRETLTTNTIN